MVQVQKRKNICKQNCPCCHSDIEELYLSLCCTTRFNIQTAEHILRAFLSRCTKSNVNKFGNIEHADILVKAYSLIGYTRDVLYGKGERDISYMFIWVWFQYFPLLAKQALRSFVFLKYVDKKSLHVRPYGSWKDIKYFAQYIYDCTQNKDHTLIEYCVGLFAEEIHRLMKREHNPNTKKKSNDQQMHEHYAYLVVKWCPRERGKHKWLFQKIVSKYMELRGMSRILMSKSLERRSFRKILAILSKKVQIIEHYLCGKKEEEIECQHISVYSQLKYFWSLYKHCNTTFQKKYVSFHQKITNTNKEAPLNQSLKYSALPIQLLMKRVIEINTMQYKPSSVPRQMIQLYWSKMQTKTTLKSTLPIVDVSRHMEDSNCLYQAIALGIYISEHTTTEAFRHHVMLYSSKIVIVDISKCNDFCEKVEIIMQAHRGDHRSFQPVVDAISTTTNEIVEAFDLSTTMASKVTFVFISNHFTESHISMLTEQLCSQPKLVFYRISNLNSTDYISTSHNNILQFTDIQPRSLVFNLSHKKISKNTAFRPSSLHVYNEILKYNRYKYMAHDILTELLTIDDLRPSCSVSQPTETI